MKSSKVTRSSKSVDNNDITINNNDITVNNSYDAHEGDNDGYTIVSRTPSSTTNAKRKQTRTINIIGDSMIKNVQPYKMQRKISPNENSFSGATVDDMKDYARPIIKRNPDLLILHCGTNDLNANKSPHEISSDIMKLALGLKHHNKDIMINGIVLRMDTVKVYSQGIQSRYTVKVYSQGIQSRYTVKVYSQGIQVNNVLKSECKKYNFLFIDNEYISAKKHLNGSGLHLNYNGTLMLVNNFLSYIKI